MHSELWMATHKTGSSWQTDLQTETWGSTPGQLSIAPALANSSLCSLFNVATSVTSTSCCNFGSMACTTSSRVSPWPGFRLVACRAAAFSKPTNGAKRHCRLADHWQALRLSRPLLDQALAGPDACRPAKLGLPPLQPQLLPLHRPRRKRQNLHRLANHWRCAKVLPVLSHLRFTQLSFSQ